MKFVVRYLMIITFSFVAMCVYSKTVDLVIVTTTGERVIRSVSDDVREWGFAQTDTTKFQILTVENIEVLTQVEFIEFINVRTIQDYSFLSKLPNLRQLSLGGCTVYDLKFLESLTNLEHLSLHIFIPEHIIDKIKSTPIDLLNLKKIKYISFNSIPVPPFINVQNRPYLILDNNNIESLSVCDLELLSNYSLVTMRYNPIVNNQAERLKCAGLPIIFDPGTTLPNEVVRHMRGELE